MAHYKKRSARVRRIILRRRIICGVMLLALVFGIAFAVRECKKTSLQNEGGGNITSSVPSNPDEPYIISSAKIGSTGDILIHQSVLDTVSDSGYDFNGIFATVKPYYSAYDVMAINLEVPFGTTKDYRGYPTFNCPASLADAVKNAGVNLLLTANNHSYDSGSSGYNNTIAQLKNRKLSLIGTRSADDKRYYVKDVNGIKIGFVCFTYATKSGGKYALNGRVMSAADSETINAFTYGNPDGFKDDAKKILNDMKKDGAEATVIYMHWGDEYAAKPNSSQTKFAGIINELGYDVIVGSHPHVVQAVDTLTNAEGKETVCIYSTGNSISNQRKEIMSEDNHSGHTEDGVVFEVQFDKYSDGTVVLSDVNALPTWVDMRTENGKKSYNIIPLDLSKNWSQFNVSSIADAKASYNRTLKRIGEGINEWRLSHGKTAIPTKAE